jgi:hypothetical protein
VDCPACGTEHDGACPVYAGAESGELQRPAPTGHNPKKWPRCAHPGCGRGIEEHRPGWDHEFVEPLTNEAPPPPPPEPPPEAPEPTQYPLTPVMLVDLDRRFTYHPPRGDQPPRYLELRAAGRNLALLIVSRTRKSREQNLALTKLEEAIFWANASIGRNE